MGKATIYLCDQTISPLPHQSVRLAAIKSDKATTGSTLNNSSAHFLSHLLDRYSGLKLQTKPSSSHYVRFYFSY